ncbi:SDR family oxidoreductase [Nesterenkonia pannonica]|uniref:SDR family oxidoreductase n=1 Tax=Nesterenkonia pannonica TaxID=1548602 RepID=UPI0021641623|nr:SDR family oxidoreductase [Nesterenkonia pannonica]
MLVTGSSRGLGRALALTLAEAGARVILHGRSAEALAETSQLIEESGQRSAGTVRFDVTDKDAVKQGIAELIQDHGVPDIVVNNAGLQRRAPIHEFDPDDWDAVLASNLSSAFYVSRFVTLKPWWSAAPARSSTSPQSSRTWLARPSPLLGEQGRRGAADQGMAADLARHNIQVNALSPGYFATEMNRDLVENETFDSWLRARTPAGRWGSFDELVSALLFLSSDASSFVSGQNIFVDGGMTAVV